MKNETIDLVIDFLALCAGFCLICGLVNAWVLIIAAVLASAAAVMALFKDK